MCLSSASEPTANTSDAGVRGFCVFCDIVTGRAEASPVYEDAIP